MKILVVDDEKLNRRLLEDVLKHKGHDVISAVNGAEALKKLQTQDFRLIISDIMMPVMDGFEFCRECKQDERLKDIPFIFYTATYTDEKDEQLALELGANRFIRKPTDPETLLTILNLSLLLEPQGKNYVYLQTFFHVLHYQKTHIS